MADEPVVEKTPEQLEKDDQNERVNSFIKEYGELVQKYKIDFATYPMFIPSQNDPGSFKIVCQNTPVDISKSPVKSNFVA